MKLTCIYCCACGVETECQWDELRLGAIFQCADCLEVRVSLLTRDGRKEWVKIAPDQVAFYRLLDEPEDEDAYEPQS